VQHVAGLAFGLAVAPTVGAAAVVPTATSSSWACIIIEHVDFGVCQGNPLPERPPLPTIPLSGLPI
jgi:hypothetical protein